MQLKFPVSAITCAPVTIPEHGNVNSSIAVFDTYVKVWCEPGHAFSDYTTSTVIVCQDNGNWSEVVEDCSREYPCGTGTFSVY